jgi:hypothetical protein
MNIQPKEARDLLLVDPKSKSLYAQHQFSLPYLAAYSVHWLTVWEMPTTYENISVLNARLFPEEFALVGFPEFPDAMRTNRTLLQMRPKYRGFATSDPRRGVYLTEKGRDAAARISEVLGPPTLEGKPVDETDMVEIRSAKSQERTRSPAKIISDCKSRLLYRRYKEGKFEETDVVHFLGLVALYDHSPPSEIRKAFRQLKADAEAVADTEFLHFLEEVEERFSAYLNRTESK